MDLSKIMTISGKPGLYRLVAQTRNGLVVESLTDGKRMPVFASDRSSALEEISLFTTDKEAPLKEVLWAIHEKLDKEELPGPKASADELRKAFEAVLPEYDRDRVYVSDMKKVFNWYRVLLEHDMISRPESEGDAAGDQPEEKSAGDSQVGGDQPAGETDQNGQGKGDQSGPNAAGEPPSTEKS